MTKVIAVKDGLSWMYHKGDVAELVSYELREGKYITVIMHGKSIEVLAANWEVYEPPHKTSDRLEK